MKKEKYCGSCGKTEKQVKLRLLRNTSDGSRLYVCSIGCGCRARAESSIVELKQAVVTMLGFYQDQCENGDEDGAAMKNKAAEIIDILERSVRHG